MPLIKSTYKPSLLFKSAHFNTIYKTIFNKQTITYRRERITTPDSDFIDLDFSKVGSNTLVIAMHGLEGSSQSKYIISVINFLNTHHIDCVALNFRGCSGEDNLHLYSYNSGKTDDLDTTIHYILEHYNYKNILLLGYSMGGNITLKYVGETKFIAPEIKGTIAISVPCDLEGSSNALAKWYNAVYIQKFLKTLKEKTLLKITNFPANTIHKEAVLKAKTFEDFDNAVTAPLFGYENAKDYWAKCSSKPFLPSINMPTLVINALDDSFLSESCYPFNEARNHRYLNLETPKYGGHVGFNTSHFKKDVLWSENRILNYINHIISS
ncbi:YheT family hydrolase [Lutibacter sp.]